MNYDELLEKSIELGIHEGAFIDADKVPFETEVMERCAANRCGQSG